MNIRYLYPLIIPSSYLTSSWKLPYYKFSIPEFVLTWVEFKGSSPMVYISQPEYDELNSLNQNWQQQSFENLRKVNRYYHTNIRYSAKTKKIVFIAFLNNDGIGSSRVLLNIELTSAFPKGYYLAFPDRSCGMIISKDITDEELEEIKVMVKGMFQNASTPMAGGIYSPNTLALPTSWTLPIDKEYSQGIINAILDKS